MSANYVMKCISNRDKSKMFRRFINAPNIYDAISVAACTIIEESDTVKFHTETEDYSVIVSKRPNTK